MGTWIVLGIVVLLVVHAVMSLKKDYENGEFCDPKHRDCAHCHTRCTSNPLYYGNRPQKK